jgi:arsenate reductase
MAEAILRDMNKNLEIYSAGIEPVNHVSPVAIEVMAEVGIDLKQQAPQHYSKFDQIEFDYLITVGDGTAEQLKIPAVKYRQKMHLGFRNPYKNSGSKEEIKQKCREIRDEIKNEMEYFYTRILKEKMVLR